MSTLTGQSIDSSYQGLIKTTDNGVISATAKAVTDGLGNATNIEISNTATNFVSGTVNFTGSTVSGLPGGAAGLENGTGADSLQSAAALTTNAADASGAGSIAIGDGAEATRQESVAIGQGAEANGSGSEGSIAIGHGSVASANRGIAIGINGTTNSSEGIVIGDNVDISGSDRSVAIGGAISISGGNDKVAIGTSASVTGQRGLAFGQNASATATEAIAMGYNVTAGTANTLSVNALETQSDGGVNIKGDGTNAGKLKLYCEDAAGTHNVTLEGPAHAGGSSYSLKLPNVQSAGTQILEADASGNLAWINTPSGGGGAAGLVAGTGADSMKSADTLTTNAATSSGNGTIAIGNGANASGANGSIAIGEGALADGDRGIAIGEGAGFLTGADSRGVCVGYNTGFGGGTDIVSIGYNSTAKANGAISLGDSARVDNSSATDAIAMGNLTTITAAAPGAVNINTGTLTAGIENTVAVKALATVVDSTPTAGGILMSDAGGTDRRLNITTSGGLQVDSTPVGITSFRGTAWSTSTHVASDLVYSTFMIPGGTFTTGDVLELNDIEYRDGLNNWGYTSIWVSDTSQTVGQAPASGNNYSFGQEQSSSARKSIYFSRKLYINSGGTFLMPYGNTNDVNAQSSSDPSVTYNINWANDQYIYYQLWSDSTTGSYTTAGTFLRKLN